MEKTYLPRIIDARIQEYLQTFGAVCIEGPKWCGKTWSSDFHSKSKIYIGNPAGNFHNRNIALAAPEMVLDGESPRLIDEWQEVPEIWDAVRFRVDQSNELGQFILTGSSTPRFKGVLHSGAGRIARLRMRTMSLFESGDSTGKVSLQDICLGAMPHLTNSPVQLQTLAHLIVRGGWPSSINVGEKQASRLPREYLNSIINDDTSRIDGIARDVSKVNLLIRSLARNESTTASEQTLISDILGYDRKTIDRSTVSTYLEILSRLFLIDNQMPWNQGVRSSVRIKQSPKRHLADPSLACAALRITESSLLRDLNTFGFLFEALCERDLKIYCESFDAELYHYQDYRGNELDAVIEMPDGSFAAIEIKLGANQIDQAADNLLRLKKLFAENSDRNEPSALIVVCGLANAAYVRDDGVVVVPITALRP